MNCFSRWLIALIGLSGSLAYAQTDYELNTGWQCTPQGKTTATGPTLSVPSFSLTGWLPAVVPGTVLTTMLANRQVPDPFYGMNNERIPDIFHVGRDYYTYWFVKDFAETPKAGEQV